MHTLLILNDPPYGTERSYNGLRLATALLKGDPEGSVTVFLMADAVLCAKRGQITPQGYYNIERMLRRVVAGKSHVLLCGTCMDARGLATEDLTARAMRSSMDELASATAGADKVIVFQTRRPSPVALDSDQRTTWLAVQNSKLVSTGSRRPPRERFAATTKDYLR